MESVTVVGGGLAGTECAFQLAERGVAVTLVEQKPAARTPAQQGDGLAELVCSNSFRGAALANAVGLLKEEMKRAGSLVMAVGEETRVPAGGAFAVDRERFSAEITRRIQAHPGIEVVNEQLTTLPRTGQVVLATGPLTSDALAADLEQVVGEAGVAYYDAIAPIVSLESLDMERVFRASRYDRGGDDAYLNAAFDEQGYHAFIRALVEAEKVPARDFEQPRFFEGCLPVEVVAERGPETLAHGCMKPVGLVDPHTGERPYAVVQLRAEDDPPTAYNLVGFQTRMTWPEQRRVLRMIPGLESAEFLRLGTLHRNTFVRAPQVLDDELRLRALPNVRLAGQITGVEGYIESAASGLSVGIALARELRGEPALRPPPETALGALWGHTRKQVPDYQPSNVIWSMFPALPGRRMRRKLKRERLAQRALEAWLAALDGREVTPPSADNAEASPDSR
ncbi:MAG: methylenetetrahydrofolate--tRNA-(uracil(54)-C(5))-methyltransferase (FADH(2)-oxidizing) TrmFO [Deltaproteobacteria bacterium]|nr:methylenetetrahydrofolate--tRNA-(uracil(54)-C(5))-methyltransferase (FADH(2)-oxidizing) TrmFO [Deltaproteobacteria bacterium]